MFSRHKPAQNETLFGILKEQITPVSSFTTTDLLVACDVLREHFDDGTLDTSYPTTVADSLEYYHEGIGPAIKAVLRYMGERGAIVLHHTPGYFKVNRAKFDEAVAELQSSAGHGQMVSV